MRPLLPSLLAFCSLQAAEALPVIELEGRDLPAPPAALRGVWDQALAASGEWAREHGATALIPATAATATRAFHLVGWALPRPAPLPPAPLASGWWEGDPAQAAALAALASDWPGARASAAGARATLDHPAAPAPAADAPAPGLRLVLHGAGLAAALAPMLEKPASTSLAPLLARLPGWTLAAGVAPDGLGWIDTGLPAGGLTAIDPALVARLPAQALAVAALGLDGSALHAALLPLLPAVLLGKLPTADQLPTGTVVAAWLGGERVLLSAPRTPAVDLLMAALASKNHGTLPAQAGQVQRLGKQGDEIWCAWDEGRWTVASDEAALRGFLAAPAAAPRWWGLPPTGALGWARCQLLGRERVGDLGAGLQPTLLLPLQPPLGGISGNGQRLAKDLGVTLVEPPSPWPALAAAISDHPHGLVLEARNGQLTARLDGPLLPWALPALALRWFADHAGDQEGTLRLRAHLAAQRAAGLGATPADLVAGLPPVADPAAVVAACEAVSKAAGEQMVAPVRDHALPLATATADQLQRARALALVSEPLTAVGPGGIDAAVLRQTPADQLGPALKLPQLDATRALARAGNLLVVHGEAAGLALVDRAHRLSARPVTLIGGLVAISVAGIRDQAWLAACIQGLGDPAPWLAEVPGDPLAAAWRGERLLYQGYVAECWLQPRQVRDLGFHQPWTFLGPHPLQPSWDRAYAAEDLVQASALMLACERGEPPPGGWRPPRSLLADLLLPAITLVRANGRNAAMNHHLLRLAGATARLMRGPGLPADAAMLATALGRPLSVPWNGTPLPCTYRRLGKRGFVLAVDSSGPCPPQMPPEQWQRWGRQPAPEPDHRLVVPSNARPLVQVNQDNAEEPGAGF
ncbi:MAG: hypothetical protein L6R48_09080 [Planctomycetes bacterium]|nr:hypothetical protein [Planctomycetota bacterium]